eukprot:Transcript_10173.p5 GENE.Transcript_10173~~Transcript_10173.p5  ORF type:complete len:132 (-),score=5.81 Transcript_10173:96-491(-)
MASLTTLMYGAAKLASVVADGPVHQTGRLLQRVLDRVISHTCSTIPAIRAPGPTAAHPPSCVPLAPPPSRTARRPAGLASGRARVVVLMTALGCLPGTACQAAITSQPGAALAASEPALAAMLPHIWAQSM